MKKLLLLFVMGICATLCGRANPIEMVLQKKAGHQVVLALEAGMTVSMSPSTQGNVESIALEITDANDEPIYTVSGGIASLSYRGEIPWPVGIEDAKAQPGLRYTLTREGVNIQGLSANACVRVYAPNGQLLQQVYASANGCTVQRAGLPKGVVLVKINDDVIKIMNP